jgi:HSP20 family molecular chaperone IbpA
MKDQDFGDVFQGMNMDGDRLKFSWSENETERILTLDVELVNGAPFDIKIEKGQVSINGTVEQIEARAGVKSRRIYRFKKALALPSDVDGNKAKFNQKPGKVLISFPKKIVGKKNDKGLAPVDPKEGDVVI